MGVPHWLQLALVLIGFLGFGRCLLSVEEFARQFGCSMELTNNCNNLHNASMCNSIPACVGQWRQLKLESDSSDQCLSCQNMLSAARGEVTRNPSLSVPRVDPQFCDLMPTSQTTALCRKHVHHNLLSSPDLWRANLNLQVMCHLVDLCNSTQSSSTTRSNSRTDHSAEPEQKSADVSVKADSSRQTLCGVCHSRMDALKLFLKRTSDETIFKSIHKVIKHVSAVETDWVRSLFIHFKTLRSMLERFNSSTACSAIQLCPDRIGSLSHPAFSSSPQSDFLLCNHVVESSKRAVASQRLNDYMKRFCHNEECHLLSASNMELTKGLKKVWPDSTAICKSIGFTDQFGSGSDDGDGTESNLHHVNLTWSQGSSQHPSSPGGRLSHPDDVADDSEECVVCITLVKNLLDYVKHHQYSIAKAVDRVCRRLAVGDAECERFFNTVIVIGGDFLLNELQPAFVCHLLHMCHPDGQMKSVEKFRSVVQSGVMSSSADALCESCLALGEVATKYLRDHIDEIVPAVRQLCNRLPAADNVQCQYLVDHYLSTIVNAIITYFTPEEICSELQLCTSDSNGISTSSALIPAYPHCRACSSLVRRIQLRISQLTRAEEGRIIANGLAFCDGSFLSVNCRSLVWNYGIYLLKILFHPLNAWKICQNMQLCRALAPSFHDTKEASQCIFCDYIVGSVNLTEFIHRTPDNGGSDDCATLRPYVLREECSHFLLDNWPGVSQSVFSGKSASQTCSGMDFCPGGIIEKSTAVLTESLREYSGGFSTRPEIPASSNCETCKEIIDLSKQFLSEHSDQDLKEMALQLCDDLPPPSSSLCEEYVNANLEHAIDTLRRDSSEQICRSKSLCLSGTAADSVREHSNRITP